MTGLQQAACQHPPQRLPPSKDPAFQNVPFDNTDFLNMVACAVVMAVRAQNALGLVMMWQSDVDRLSGFDPVQTRCRSTGKGGIFHSCQRGHNVRSWR